jgi:hypothetical protein
VSTPVKTLAARREALVFKAQQQRMALQLAAADVQTHLGFADRALALAQRIRRAPLLSGVLALSSALLALRPNRTLKWISYAATAYSLIRRLRSWVSSNAR